ncbi:DUF4112 domain-containing protein [Aliiroseovarius sp. PTFE2010]|uniref:DUF4112 domain-containing protein n=1 Tax=Aliiroseovarius sp. PTFE2010 TaxID=3417190 RepID=UPI003CF9147B
MATAQDTLHGDHEVERLERLAVRMDSALRLPGTNIRFGWDSLLGLLPGVGDAATLAPTGYIIYRAHKLGAPLHIKARMGLNAGIDWVIGTVPLIGDIFDVGFKANRRNVALLKTHVERTRLHRDTHVPSPPRQGEIA